MVEESTLQVQIEDLYSITVFFLLLLCLLKWYKVVYFSEVRMFIETEIEEMSIFIDVESECPEIPQ